MKRLAVSIKRAGRVIGVRRSSVYSLLRKGKLRAVKIGSRTLVTTESLEELVVQAERPLLFARPTADDVEVQSINIAAKGPK